MIRIAGGRISKSAVSPEQARGKVRVRVRLVCRHSGAGRRVGCVRIEAVHRPVVALGLREVVIETDTEVECKIASHAPIVVQKDRHELILHGVLRVQIETSAEVGIPRRNCARSCPNTLVLLTAGSLVHVPVKA